MQKKTGSFDYFWVLADVRIVGKLQAVSQIPSKRRLAGEVEGRGSQVANSGRIRRICTVAVQYFS
jgi:hypothetical protein